MSSSNSEFVAIDPFDFAQAINDFELSLLNSNSSESVLPLDPVPLPKVNTVINSAPGFSKIDSLRHRISRVEALFGIHQFTFWKVKPDQAVSILTDLCRDILDSTISEGVFTVVQRLHNKFPGVLVQVPSAELKQLILAKSEEFKGRGFLVTPD